MGVSRRASPRPWRIRGSGSDLLQVARFAKMGGSQSSDAPEEAPEGEWLCPRCVAHAKKPFYKWVVDSLVIWLEMNMWQEEGGFSSSTDAESQEEEGRHYVWSQEQLAEVLDDNEQQMFAKFFDVGPQGNFRQAHSVLTQRRPISRCAKELGWDFELAVRVLNEAREKAFEAREQRVLAH